MTAQPAEPAPSGTARDATHATAGQHVERVTPRSTADGCRVREVLDLVADKWSLYVVGFLGTGPRRFTELRRGVEGISQRMLTVTLRGLERDGILTRTVHQVMPPKVTYELTRLGASLLDATAPLVTWSVENLDQITDARAGYDQRQSSTVH